MQWVKNRLLTFVGIALLGLVAATPVAVVTSSPAIAEPATVQQDITCAIEKLGWLLCPVIEKAGSLTDGAYGLVTNLLEVEAELLGGGSSGTKRAWDISVGIANVMFIITFLVIVASQISGFGLTNYGIKRMLPRLIIAAIAVNSSYYICQLLVDLSNIFGYQIKSLLTDLANQVSGGIPIVQQAPQNGAGTFLGFAVIILGSVALVGYWLPALMSIIFVVGIATLSTIIILLIRKALIVLLVVLAPIAFVMYLLPNTEKLFNRWAKVFFQLLMVFPVVALLFGGGNLAAAIVLSAGSQDNTGYYRAGTDDCINYSLAQTGTSSSQSASPSPAPAAITKAPCGERATPVLLGLLAAGISVVPLFMIYPVLQGALAATGSLGGKIQALSSKSVGAGRKRLSEDREHLSNRRTLAALNNPHGFSNIVTANTKRRKVFRDYARAGTKAELDYTAQAETSKKVTKSASYRRQVAGGNAMIPESINIAGKSLGMSGTTVEAIDRAKGRALGAQSKQAQEEIQNAQVIINTETKGDMDAIAAALTRAIENENEVGAKAAQNLLLGMGGSGVDTFAKTIIEFEKSGGTEKTSFLKQYTAQNHSDIKQKSGDISKWMSNQTGSSLQSFSVSRDSFTLSDDEIASQTVGALHAAFMSDALDHEDADRILKSNSAAKLGQEQRAMLRTLAAGRGAYSARNVALANPPDPKQDRTI